MKRTRSERSAAWAVLLFLLLLPMKELTAQAPDSVNYQAVARDDQGKVLSNEELDVRISVIAGSSSGTLVYEEEHTGVTTNQFGLFTLYIGGGSQTGGSAASFDAIGWGTNEHHIEVEVNAGSGYESLGSRKFVSVPYALYAESAGTGGGGGSLQSAYEGGNQIAIDTANYGPFQLADIGQSPVFYSDGDRVSIGKTSPITNTRLDVEYTNGSGFGPGLLSASAPISLPDSVYDNPFFQQNNTGVFGVGAGTSRAIGVTGFTVHNSLTATSQDSIYGVTGIARDLQGATAVGVSGVSQAYSSNVERSVGVYGRVSDPDNMQQTNNPRLAGGVFEAVIDRYNSNPSVDTTLGAVGIGAFGGERNIGVFGWGRTPYYDGYGVVGLGGSGDTSVGVMGIGDTSSPGGIAGWFLEGKTLIQDTLQVAYGNPAPGEVLMAVGPSGKAVWDTVPTGGTPIISPFSKNGSYKKDSLGIGTGSPSHELHVEGKSYSSKGFVTSSARGYSYETHQHRVQGLEGFEFDPMDVSSTNAHFRTVSGAASFAPSLGNSGKLAHSIDLPDGALVDTVIYHLHDEVRTDSLVCSIETLSYGSAGQASTVPGSRVTSRDGGGQSLVRELASPLRIRNGKEVYRIVGRFSEGHGKELRIDQVELRYRVKKAD